MLGMRSISCQVSFRLLAIARSMSDAFQTVGYSPKFQVVLWCEMVPKPNNDADNLMLRIAILLMLIFRSWFVLVAKCYRDRRKKWPTIKNEPLPGLILRHESTSLQPSRLQPKPLKRPRGS